MNFLLTIILLIICFINMCIGRSITYPALLVSGVFWCSSLFLLMNENEWCVSIDSSTFEIILISTIVFSLGSFLGSKIKIKNDFKNVRKEIYIPNSIFNISILIITVILISFLVNRINIAASIGVSGNIFDLLYGLRLNMKIYSEYYTIGSILNLGIVFLRAYGFICLYIFISSYIRGNIVERKKYVIPILALMLCEILSTSRIGLIVFVFAGVFDYYILSKNTLFGSRKIKFLNCRKFFRTMIGLVLFVIGFYALGLITGQSKVYSLWDTISVYFGSSIVCLNDGIINSNNQNFVFGQYSFRGVNRFLSFIGVDIPDFSNHLENVYFGELGSNVYTALFPYVQDFGVPVSYMLQCFVGIVFGYMWKKYMLSSNGDFIQLVYGRFFGSALLLYSVAERLFSEYVSLNVFAELFFYVFLAKCILKYRYFSNL